MTIIRPILKNGKANAPLLLLTSEKPMEEQERLYRFLRPVHMRDGNMGFLSVYGYSLRDHWTQF